MEKLMKDSAEDYLSEISDKMPERWHENISGVNFFLNPYSYLQLKEHQELIASADNIFIDGIFLCKLLSLFSIKRVQRCSFDYTSIANAVFENGVKKNLKFSIIGSTLSNITEFIEKIRNRYPGIDITYSRDGYINSNEEKLHAIDEILHCDILICGMGSPLQEKFITDVKLAGFRGVAYSCGGFIHQTASKESDYYPDLINKLNLRFIYRMYDEPKLIRRYFIDYPKFLFEFLKDRLKYKKSESPNVKT